jgi:16S rRNA C967 or C1407 C5-methylase (RsmB/RsmF family)
LSRKGPEGFQSFYSALYGARWPLLRESLLSKPQQVARPNAFASVAAIEKRVSENLLSKNSFAGHDAFLLQDRFETRATEGGVADFYVLDPASIFPAVALDVQPGDEVADLCAAPGGKSLILAESLWKNSKSPTSGRLVANELSDPRRARLRAVIGDYVPSEVREKIRVTGHDATRWCLYETEAYDRILLDAPCSGERHLLANSEEMNQWSPARSKNLAVRQYALLASALAVVRVGGRIVYSTCSLSNLENDNVIARLLKKRAGEARVVKRDFEIGEPTEHGWMILPDTTGFGPIYFAIIERGSVSI